MKSEVAFAATLAVLMTVTLIEVGILTNLWAYALGCCVGWGAIEFILRGDDSA